jgi:hypothetical protein
MSGKVFLLKSYNESEARGRLPQSLKRRFIIMQKSDAMLQHEKTIEFVLAHNPKGSNDDVMHIEVRNYVVAVAAILVVVIAAVSMMH